MAFGDGGEDLPAARVARGGATADPVKDYLKQIGKVPLLNAGQEVELAKRMEADVFADHMLAEGGGVRRPGQSVDLERVAEDGRRAKNHLVEANLRLVDLVGQAVCRPGDAVAGSDPGGQPGPDPWRGEVRLRQGLQVLHVRHLVDPAGHHPRDGGPGADDPDPGAYMVEADQQAGPGQRQMLQDLGREPTGGARGQLDMTPEKRSSRCRSDGREPISLHTPLGGDGDSEFGDLIEDSEAIQPGEAVKLHAAPGAGDGARHAARREARVVRSGSG